MEPVETESEFSPPQGQVNQVDQIDGRLYEHTDQDWARFVQAEGNIKQRLGQNRKLVEVEQILY